MDKNELIQHFSNYEDNLFVEGVKTILNALDNIKEEPKLLEFLITICKKNHINLTQPFYVIEYGENYQYSYNWVFTNEVFAIECAKTGFNSDKNEKVPSWVLFELYRIRKLEGKEEIGYDTGFLSVVLK